MAPNTPKLLDEDGYELWLRYALIEDTVLRTQYENALQAITFNATSPTQQAAMDELMRGMTGLLTGRPIATSSVIHDGTLLVGTPQSEPAIAALELHNELETLGDEGYALLSQSIAGKRCTIITANSDIGLLYGSFALLRHLQTHRSLHNLHVLSAPQMRLRMLNHWDNLDGTIERGYAGFSLWDWHKLPHYIDPRYCDYARAMASIGLNAASLTNVNANALVLTKAYIAKAAALADAFRPYGIRIYLTARFSAPLEIGHLDTADPLDPNVAHWWQQTAAMIYEAIPDFGGFVVKANSEGQPGPHDYGCTHADGANMLADALAPYGGTVIWRAFVYDADVTEDRHKQANNQLVPLDGAFRDNVLLQVKNGAIDFQPREPFHPLFGRMPQTPLVLEVQLTQEYLGFATHLAYLAPLFKETLDADTYCQGPGSTVAKIVNGELDGHPHSGIAAVSNIGNDRNWCGHPFAAANWYAFGRLAWDPALTSDGIAEEWIRMTFSNELKIVDEMLAMMLPSREAVVNYMTPLGLHHIMARDHHYGPGPWVDMGRADWTALYYHQADADGIGFDRTSSGSNAISQYFPSYAAMVSSVETCPETLLLWFHHVSWDHVMASGRSLWEELCFAYDEGVDMVRQMQARWTALEGLIDSARYEHIKVLLRIQLDEACWWRDACLLYFQSISGRPFPVQIEQPGGTLADYMAITHYYVPGIPERRF